MSLVLRGNVYYLRQVVRKKLRPVMKRREFMVSLGTSDKGEAVKRHAALSIAIERQITTAMRKLALAGPAPDTAALWLREALKDHPDLDPEALADLHGDALEALATRPADKLLRARVEGFRRLAAGSAHVPTMSALVEQRVVEEKPGAKLAEGWRVAVARFVGVVGDLPITEVDAAVVRAWRAHLAGLPLQHSSVMRLWATVSGVLNFARRSGYVPYNPMAGMAPRAAGGAGRGLARRRAFTEDELVVLLPHTLPRYALIIRMCLGLGARLSEVALASASDLKTEAGVYHLCIGGSSSVKSRSSRRRVPIPSRLIEAVRAQAVSKTGRLFPNVLPATLSKWFMIHCQRVGLTDPALVFHSLRHTFATRARAASCPREIAEVLMGHASGRVSAGYGDSYSLATLSEWIERISS